MPAKSWLSAVLKNSPAVSVSGGWSCVSSKVSYRSMAQGSIRHSAHPNVKSQVLVDKPPCCDVRVVSFSVGLRYGEIAKTD